MIRDRHIGQVLDGRYEIVKLIGRGGMGAVYEAVHRGLDKPVAIKMLLASAAGDREAYARFLREARAASKLNHPHIVEVTDFSYSEDGDPFLVMEYLQGEDLHHALVRDRRLSLARAAPIFQKVFSAIQVAHEGGIIHRDLKPQNIFLCRYSNIRDFPKVLDFGISKILDAVSALTTPESYIGTPQFMAPEQAEGRAQAADPRTDVFALGAILYRALAGEGPFGGESPVTVFYNVVHSHPRQLREVSPAVPASVDAVVHQALAKSPADRFGSVAELSAAFCSAAGLPDEAAIVAPAPSPAHDPPLEGTVLDATLASDGHLAFQSTLGSASGEKLEPTTTTVGSGAEGSGGSSSRTWVALGGGLLALLMLGGIVLSTGRGPGEPEQVVAAPTSAPDPDASTIDGGARGRDMDRDGPPDLGPRPTSKRTRKARRPVRVKTGKQKQPAEEQDVEY